MPIYGDNEAIGAWTKAMMYLWKNGPTDRVTLGLVVGLGWDRVGFLFTEKDGLLSLPWMEEYRAERALFLERQRENGRKGGRPKATSSKAENPSLSSGLTQTIPKKSPRVEDEDRVVDEDEVEDAVEGKDRGMGKGSTFSDIQASEATKHHEGYPSTARPPKAPQIEKGEAKTGQSKTPDIEIQWPKWAGPQTKQAWERFKEYRRITHKFKYKTLQSEQAAITMLGKMYSSGQECVDHLTEAEAKGWRFPVEPRPSQNGHDKTPAVAPIDLNNLKAVWNTPTGR